MAEQRKQHLYLVFDDWNSGYSIRKVSLSRRSGKRSESSSDSEDEEQPALSSGRGKGGGAKPLPFFMRVSALRGYPELFTSAFGTKIMTMLKAVSAGIIGIPTIDVQDQTLTFDPQPNPTISPIFFTVSDDRLFVLDVGKFQVLRKPEPGGPWVWQRLSSPPFWPDDVSSHVVHDGCILVSTKQRTTFIFDTKEYVWRQYGDWGFDFTGCGHYDSRVEGFVGLPKDPQNLGYIYCCTMASAATGDTGTVLHPSPDLTCTKNKVFNNSPAEGHVSATLVHMRQGRFCLVECVSIGDRKTKEEYIQENKVPPGVDRIYFVGGGPQRGRFMYRLITFFLSYDRNGDLKLKDRKEESCRLPHEARIGSIFQDPVAFWL